MVNSFGETVPLMNPLSPDDTTGGQTVSTQKSYHEQLQFYTGCLEEQYDTVGHLV